MNKKLIFLLSLFGLAMGISTISWISSRVEPLFWLVIMIFCAYIIVTKCTGNYFLYGLFVSIVNSFWIIAAHILFFSIYIANHVQEGEMMKKMPMHEHPRLLMLITGLIIGVISGLVLGLFSFIAFKIVRKP